MQKTLLYLAVLAILGFGVWYFLFSSPGSAFSTAEAGFNIRDTGKVGKIFLANNGAGSVTLTRTDSGWRANGYAALQTQVNYLLATMAQQEALNPVPANQHNSVVSNMAGRAIKVEVYNRSGEKLRTFYVGNEVHGFSGTYMLMEGAKDPYIVNIPGFEGVLTPRYAPDLKIWRDRTVFRLAAADIREASVDYGLAPGQSFTVHHAASDSVTVTLASPATTPLNTARVHSYLNFFSEVNSAGNLNGTAGLDSVIRTMPRVATISVATQSKGTQQAIIYFFPLNRRSKNLGMDITDTASNYDADHYYGVINGGRDTMIIQQHQLEKILRPGPEFFEADKVRAMPSVALPGKQ